MIDQEDDKEAKDDEEDETEDAEDGVEDDAVFHKKTVILRGHAKDHEAADDRAAVEDEGAQEEHEVAIVSLADAIPHERTMVIEDLDAVIAISTSGCCGKSYAQ
jgi:hypothetical protein